ncbi:MAG: ATP phosphoribosyltransferase regulatory subunit [Lautropia sp.]
MTRWLLPDGISDLLPTQAGALESLRRQLLDHYAACGYEMVVPPLVEYLDALLVASGSDLDLKTFKLVDQVSGRTLGVRADITPQVARIDAHLLQGREVTRLCYCAPVLQARSAGLGASREPIQIGAELYGVDGPEADIEAIDTLLRSLAIAGVARARLDLSDLSLVRLVLRDLPEIDEAALFATMRSRDLPGLDSLLAGASSATAVAAIKGLARCFGAVDVALRDARALLAHWPQADALLARLERVCGSPRVLRHREAVEIGLDFADVPRFRYHTGLGFSAYVEGHAQAIGRGGRYDGVGRMFGRARAATGFSLDLRELVALGEHRALAPAILAPWSDDPALLARIDELRLAGEVVVQSMPGQSPADAGKRIDRVLQHSNGAWRVVDRQ